MLVLGGVYQWIVPAPKNHNTAFPPTFMRAFPCRGILKIPFLPVTTGKQEIHWKPNCTNGYTLED